MAAFTTVLAFDLGASTGRAIRAVYDGERLKWKESTGSIIYRQ